MKWFLVLVLALGCGSSSTGSGGNGGTGGSGGSGGAGGSGGSGGSGGTGGTGGSGGSMPDAADYGPPGELTCGFNGVTATCTPGQICCATFIPTTQLHCRTSCNGGESSFRCDGPEDCNGQICCISFNNPGAYCAAQCNSGDSEVCHNHTTCPSSAAMCCTSNGAPSGLCIAQMPQGSTCN